jgi:hypothetical protein
MNASSLSRHLADIHKLYQQTVVAEELLEDRAGVFYRATTPPNSKLACPFPDWVGELESGWMIRRHFWDIHPKNLVTLLKKQWYPCCKNCSMQVNLGYSRHTCTKECAMDTARPHQQEAAVALAPAPCCQLMVYGDTLNRVKVFKHLRRMMEQDNNNIQAMHHQLYKAPGTWAHIGQVLRRENVTPQQVAKFYNAVVQALLLYSSKTWKLTKAVLVWLKRFHV